MKKKGDQVNQARKRFNKDLHTEIYEKIHSDDQHLQKLLDLLNITSGSTYVDLGTGTGYIGFEIAKRCPDCSVIGIDVADKAIKKNIRKKLEKKLLNIDFYSYNGITLPLKDSSIDAIIIRYAFHHFPEPKASVYEFYRVLKENGIIIISDPIINKLDCEDFINKLQELKKDGHNKFYDKKELIELFNKNNFALVDSFMSKITAPREKNTDSDKLLKNTSPKILSEYKIELNGNSIYMTLDILNVKFRKL